MDFHYFGAMAPTLAGYLLVFLGGGIGAALRHGVNRLPAAMLAQFPGNTLLVNVLGCFVMGLLAAWFTFRGEDSSQHLRLFLTTGILGGFTTFSAFSLDAALLWQRGQTTQAAIYVGASVALSLAGVFGGLSLMRSLIA